MLNNLFGIDLDLDEETAKNFMLKLVNAIEDVEDLKFLLEREFGKVPPSQEEKQKVMENVVDNEIDRTPFIVDETTITEIKEFEVEDNVGVPATKGHLVNISPDKKLKVQWDRGSGYLPEYTVATNEVLEFDDEKIEKLKIKPYNQGEETKFKFILK